MLDESSSTAHPACTICQAIGAIPNRLTFEDFFRHLEPLMHITCLCPTSTHALQLAHPHTAEGCLGYEA